MWPRHHIVTSIPYYEWQRDGQYQQSPTKQLGVPNECLEKFFENALKASSSWNWTVEGEGSIDEEAPEQRRFQAGMDLRLGAIDTTNVNRFRGRRREAQSEKSQAIQIYQIYEKRVRMHGKCMNMWHIKQQENIMGSAQSNPTSTQAYYTHLNAWKYH